MFLTCRKQKHLKKKELSTKIHNNVILTGEMLEAFPAKLGMRKRCPFSLLYSMFWRFHPVHKDQRKKRDTNHLKEKTKLLFEGGMKILDFPDKLSNEQWLALIRPQCQTQDKKTQTFLLRVTSCPDSPGTERFPRTLHFQCWNWWSSRQTGTNWPP